MGAGASKGAGSAGTIHGYATAPHDPSGPATTTFIELSINPAIPSDGGEIRCLACGTKMIGWLVPRVERGAVTIGQTCVKCKTPHGITVEPTKLRIEAEYTERGAALALAQDSGDSGARVA